MKVYALKASGTYGGGMAIVAASDEEEAKMVASTIYDYYWRTRYDEPESVDVLPVHYDGTRPIVLDHYETGE